MEDVDQSKIETIPDDFSNLHDRPIEDKQRILNSEKVDPAEERITYPKLVAENLESETTAGQVIEGLMAAETRESKLSPQMREALAAIKNAANFLRDFAYRDVVEEVIEVPKAPVQNIGPTRLTRRGFTPTETFPEPVEPEPVFPPEPKLESEVVAPKTAEKEFNPKFVVESAKEGDVAFEVVRELLNNN